MVESATSPTNSANSETSLSPLPQRDLEELVIQLRRQVTSLTKENKMLSSEQARSNKEIKSLLRDNAALREERRSIRMALGFDSKFGHGCDRFSPSARAMAA
jgi:chromosome segregation ATPase